MVAQSLTDLPSLAPAPDETETLVPPVVILRDRRQVELRQAYALPEAGGTLDYVVEFFLFLPRAMGVTPATYPKADFYTDAHVYTRLDAPGRSLRELGDLNDERSPLAKVHAVLPRLLEARAPATEPLVSLVQLHAHELSEAVVTATLTAARDARTGTPEGPAAFERDVERLLDDADGALVAIRQVRAEAEAFGVLCHPGLQKALGFAEEYVSAVLDEQVALLSDAVRDSRHLRDGEGTAVRVLLRLGRFAVEESRLRLEAGYALPWDEPREYFAYRLGLLKKALQQALYLNTREARGEEYIRDSAAMVAAGLAATWAFLAQIPMLNAGAMNTSTYLVLLASAVGAYMLKDRIKEWTRNWLMRRLRLNDYSRRIVADALRRFGLDGLHGRARERVRYLHADEVDDDIRAVRLLHRSVMGVGVELEDVLHYRRQLTLTADEKATVPPGFGIREILRLNTTALTRRLDDPLDEVAYYDAPSGQFRRAHLPKVYHANLIVRVSARHAPYAWVVRHRVVLNQDGLVRVEPVVTQKCARPDAR
ncbi:MAG: hypothetical protein HY904_09490 [Deltaproteobacteria bacterium]|nr:hypothetical protein [Deltaproteobacteria bacterium]